MPSATARPDAVANAEEPSRGRPGGGLRALSLSLLALRVGPVLILLLLALVLSFAVPVFITSRNLGNVLAQTAVIATVAMGQHLVILTRGIDLSVGSNLALASVLGALAY